MGGEDYQVLGDDSLCDGDERTRLGPFAKRRQRADVGDDTREMTPGSIVEIDVAFAALSCLGHLGGVEKLSSLDGFTLLAKVVLDESLFKVDSGHESILESHGRSTCSIESHVTSVLLAKGER